MVARDFDAVFFVQSPPVIRLEDGLFHIGYDIGKNAHFEVVLSPATYFKAMRAATKVAESFHAGGTVVPLKARAKR